MRIDISISHSFGDPSVAALFATRCKALFAEFESLDIGADVSRAPTRGAGVASPAPTTAAPSAVSETTAHHAPAEEAPARRAAVWGPPPPVIAPSHPATESEVVPSAPISAEAAKPKRRRRTREQIAADEAAALAARNQSAVVAAPVPDIVRRAEQMRANAESSNSDTLALRTRLTEQFNEMITRPDGIASIKSILDAHKLSGFANISADQLPQVVRHFDRVLSAGAAEVVNAPHTTDDDWN